ncbi:MAG: CDP-alcohol phosphatidyltransferase family protein [Flavobacteriales bacterium]|jgi:CDP-diacylglycerol---serine O-phosphatidyltransferase|nr:CDP-alcohol phosphatidyltransferase family protein [Flavobacteriales bacterium]
MSVKQQIPNGLTLLNLLSGLVAVLFAAIGELEMAAYFVFLGIFFDYFDGFAARLLNVQGELGKQLDSLADVVTSGVVPGIVMFQLLRQSLELQDVIWFTSLEKMTWLPFIGLIITLASAYRLANFNIDTRQTDSFIGLPTPALTLFVLSLPLILVYQPNQFIISLIENQYVLIAITLIGSYLMNANIAMFALKFKSFKLKENYVKYIFLAISLLLLGLLQFIAIPIILIIYIVISILDSLLTKKLV